MIDTSIEYPSYVGAVREFFDEQYRLHERYWWKGDNRYSLDPAQHTAFHAKVLQLVIERTPGRVLDVGAGEGADAIRLAKLGYGVDAIELSSIACEKMEKFARDEGVELNVVNESILSVNLEGDVYDVVVMNGSLHYIREKAALLQKVKRASKPEALHVMSLFSSVTPVPAEHATAPVFPDDEHGTVEGFYSGEQLLQLAYVREKLELSHPGFAHHKHSFIKQIVRLGTGRGDDRLQARRRRHGPS